MSAVVTGLGVVSPIGVGVDAFWEASLSGCSGAQPIDSFDAEAFPVRFAARCADFDPTVWLDRKAARNMDRFAQFGVAAAALAVEDAQLSFDGPYDRGRVGVVIASGIGGITTIYEQTSTLVERGPARVSPFFVPKMMMNAAAGAIAMRYGLTGANFATASACAGSSHALGLALMLLRADVVDAVLVGGAEAAVNPLGLAAFCAARALSTRNDDPATASRPFDRDRDGFVMGEGAGVVVLERAELARARGARVYAELAGFGFSDDAHHMTAPDPQARGAIAAMRLALADARLGPEAIELVNAHGTATPLGDVAETVALKAVFGDLAASVPVTATKSQIGHLLGASGVLGLVSAVKSIETAVIAPTINYQTPDPDCDVNLVANEPREQRVDAAMVNSFGFGGHNASLVVRRAV